MSVSQSKQNTRWSTSPPRRGHQPRSLLPRPDLHA